MRTLSLLMLVALLVSFAAVSVLAEGGELGVAGLNREQGTIQLWVTTNWAGGDPASSNVMFWWGTAEWSNELRLFFWNAQVLAARWMSDGTVVAADVPIKETWQANTWYHIATTWDAEAGTIAMYVDGELLAEKDDWVPSSAGYADMSLGSRITGADALEGSIQGGRIYDYVMTAEQIAELFNATKADFDK